MTHSPGEAGWGEGGLNTPGYLDDVGFFTDKSETCIYPSCLLSFLIQLLDICFNFRVVSAVEIWLFHVIQRSFRSWMGGLDLEGVRSGVLAGSGGSLISAKPTPLTKTTNTPPPLRQNSLYHRLAEATPVEYCDLNSWNVFSVFEVLTERPPLNQQNGSFCFRIPAYKKGWP